MDKMHLGIPNKPEQLKGVLFRPDCVTCKDMVDNKGIAACDIGGCDKPLREQPNTNAMIIKTIQGLMTCVANELEKLPSLKPDNPIKELALEETDLFERTTLFELQRCFE